MKRKIAVAVVLALVAGISCADSGEGSPARKYFTNVELVNQDGETMRFYDDLLEGKVVIIDAIFTTCTGICPVMSKTLVKVQEHVGDRLGEDVHLLSISLDPDNDTPEKLKEYASRWGARSGWYFLTGDKEDVELALHKLGQRSSAKKITVRSSSSATTARGCGRRLTGWQSPRRSSVSSSPCWLTKCLMQKQPLPNRKGTDR
jgi:cytochrome oxidase Cu insertion factor (SCO1/SenC/PrrC family)